MLTDKELCSPYLNPGMATSVDMLALYWSAVLERHVQVEEVDEALKELRRRYCREHAEECEEDKRRWDNLIKENHESHLRDR